MTKENVQSNTILQRTISEKDLMASDQQEKYLLAQNRSVKV